MRLLLLLAIAGCGVAAPTDDAGDVDDGGKSDNGSSARFTEIDHSHTNKTFRAYIEKGLDALAASDAKIAKLTLKSIGEGRVKIDELSDLTCADFLRVAHDLPDLHLKKSDYAKLKVRGSAITKAIAAELDGYMWSNRIYVSRGQDATTLASSLVHETNHVINRSEVGYYDDLPTSAFVHEYRAFYAESIFDPEAWTNTDLVDYVITEYDLDRAKIDPAILAKPLTPTLLPDTAAWTKRRVQDDPVDTDTCN